MLSCLILETGLFRIMGKSLKIHYVWVGGKPLPRLAKKCIRSWKKYLPDCEIIEWNEKNFDIENSIPFVKQAYAQKKWAFVADYIRTQVLYEHGGVYFDTDMEVLGNVDKFFEKPAFMGKEYEGDEREMVCAGVMYFAEKRDPFLRKMLDFYEGIKHFNTGLMYSYAIPKVITRILDGYDRKVGENGIEVYGDSIWVYPKDYFYPVNYDWTKEFYSENTVMIHHYDASWTGTSNKRNVFIRKSLPSTLAEATIKSIGTVGNVRRIPKQKAVMLNTLARTIASKHLKVAHRIVNLKTEIDRFAEQDYLMFSNPKWVGVSHVADDLFGGYVPVREIDVYTKKEIHEVAKTIASANKRLIIMNGLVSGWDKVIEHIRHINPDITIKVLYHGGDVRLARSADYGSFMKILGLHNMNLIDEIGFVKKQQAEFYARKGYRVKFVANNIVISDPEVYKDQNPSKTKDVRIGLYCSGDVEWKNMFNQVAAASLIDDVELDVIPVSHMLTGYADKLGVRLTGSDELLPRDALLARMANNNVNMYVSFAEASPLLPLESMEVGTPCITANNHHYWQGTPLEEFLVVSRPDDMLAIHEQVEKVLKNRSKIMALYKEWKVDYNRVSSLSAIKFLEVVGAKQN